MAVEQNKEISFLQKKNHYDVIVMGVGSMGSSACYFLSQRKYKVLGLEQFDIPHDQGSHAGQSRIIRQAYYEHPDYVPLLNRAYHNWQEVEKQTGSKLYFKTGLLYHGNPHHAVIKGTKLAAAKYNIQLNDISDLESAKQFPQFNLPAGFTSFLEPDAGFITPERAILTYTEESLKQGADIKTKEKVIEWKKEKGNIVVVTDKNIYFCKKLIITTGAWTGKIIPDLKTELKVTRQIIAWIKPENWEPFELGNFPCWMLAPEEKGGVYYGFPILPAGQFGGPIGLKVAHHYPSTTTDPDAVNRTITREDEEELRSTLQKYLPAVNGEILVIKTCLYTNSKDENFIIDHLPGYDEDVVVACGFSGHGFKFVSVVGEIIADLAMEGKTDMPIEFLRLKRFE